MPSTSTDRLYGMTTSVAVKPPCRVATNAAITLSGEQTVNGVAVVTDDRVLVKDQADTTQNGIWVVNTSAWSRSPDFDGSLDAVNGTIVLVQDASSPGTIYELQATNPVIIGTSALVFSLSSSQPAATFVAWGGLINAATSKSTPVDADAIAIMDSAAGNATKKLTWANLKATLKTYFDTLYVVAGAITASGLTQTTGRLLGRTTASTGAIEQITPSAVFSFSAGALDIAAGGITPAKLSQPFTLGTPITTTGGTSVDSAAIPSWVTEVAVLGTAVSTNGTSGLIVQGRAAGAPETSGYVSNLDNNSAPTLVTTGFGLFETLTAVNTYMFVLTLRRFNGTNTWIADGFCADTGGAQTIRRSISTKTFAAALDSIRLTTLGGVNTFDVMSINVNYK